MKIDRYWKILLLGSGLAVASFAFAYFLGIPAGWGFVLWMAGECASISAAEFHRWFSSNYVRAKPEKPEKRSEESKVLGDIKGQLDVEVATRPTLLRFCPFCQKELKPQMKFCPSCGGKLREGPDPPANPEKSLPMVIENESLPLKVLEFFNGVSDVLQAFELKSRFFDLASVKLKQGKIDLALFTERIREIEAEVKAQVEEAEGRISQLEDVKKLLEGRAQWATSNITRLEKDLLGLEEGDEGWEAAVADRRFYETELRIADELLRRAENYVSLLSAAKTNLNIRIREAFLETIREAKAEGGGASLLKTEAH